MGLLYLLDRKIKGTLKRRFGITFQTPSETAKVRNIVMPYRQKSIAMNPYHVYPGMGYDYMMARLDELTGVSYKILYSNNCKIDYNVIIVAQITKHNN